MSIARITKDDVLDALDIFKSKCDEEYLPIDAASTKLYQSLGANTDGAVAQATITQALADKITSDAKVANAYNADSATTATKATQDSSGRVITDTYVVKVTGKDLSTNDYTTTEKNKLAGIADSAQVNVIETVKVNGTALTPSSKAVNVDLSGYLTTTGKAASATKADQLTNSQNIITNLGSTNAGSFNGTASVSAGVTGTLPVANGGTGATSLANITVGTATKADYPTGFSYRRSDNPWGPQTGSLVTAWEDGDGGSIAFRKNCPSSGKVSMIIDGNFYQNEGNYQCLDTSYLPLSVANGGTGATSLANITVGTATKATADASGNVINTTYLTKTAAAQTYVSIKNFKHGDYGKRYGVRIAKNEADPYARVEYILDAVGMTPAKMDYTAGVFNYGSWANVWFVADNKPCMLKSDGTVDYYLDPNDYSKREDGTTGSDVANTSYDGNAMAQIPLVWVYRYEDDDYYYEIVSPTQYDSNYKAYAHTNASGTVKDYFYYALFEACFLNNKLRSIAGRTPDTDARTFPAKMTAATANGSGWNVASFSQYNLFQTLLVIMGKSTNTQAVFGHGHCRNNAASGNTLNNAGTLNTKGQFWGSTSIYNSIKTFHVENLWGNGLNQFAGIFYDNGKFYVKMTPEGDGYTTGDITGYTLVTTVTTTANPTHNRYVSKIICSQYGHVPIELSGSTATYFCDAAEFGEWGPCVVALGGSIRTNSSARDLQAGAFFWATNREINGNSNGCTISYV